MEISGSPLFISHSRTVSVTSKEIHSAVPLVSTFLAPMKRCFLMCSFRLTICEAKINSWSEAFFLNCFSCSCSDCSIIVLNHVRKECIQYINKLWIQKKYTTLRLCRHVHGYYLKWEFFVFALKYHFSRENAKNNVQGCQKHTGWHYSITLTIRKCWPIRSWQTMKLHTQNWHSHIWLSSFISLPRFKSSPWKGFFKSSNFSDRKMTVKCHLCVGKG